MIIRFNLEHCGVYILTCFMKAHWIFGEPRDDVNAELDGKKKCECIILKLKKRMDEVLQEVQNVCSSDYKTIEGSVASE